MKMNKKIASLGLASVIFIAQAVVSHADNFSDQGINENKNISNNYASSSGISVEVADPQIYHEISPLVSQQKKYSIPGDKGTLISNAWRETGDGTVSGNTLQWEYQVSAVYQGSNEVERIRTTWQGSASLRNGASISLGISGSGVSAGSGSQWQTVKTVEKYWENNNGSKESSWRSNMIVTPKVDYRSGTIGLINTAMVKLKNDAKTYEISSGV